MSDIDGQGAVMGEAGGGATRQRNALKKVLPTDRVTFAKQMSVLRAYAAACGPTRNAVSNNEVADVLKDLVASSVSLCNPFFVDVGLLTREGTKQRPTDALLDYFHAFEWNADTAGMKLYRNFSETWAAKALLPKLAFRSLSKDEAIEFLANESKATKGHRRNLETLLDFLNVAGVLRLDGNVVTKAQAQAPERLNDREVMEERADEGSQNQNRQQKPEDIVNDDVHRLEVPVPGKPSVVVLIPKSLDEEDWVMFQQMFSIYVGRWKGFKLAQKARSGDEGGSAS